MIMINKQLSVLSFVFSEKLLHAIALLNMAEFSASTSLSMEIESI